jgi:alpha-L-rhamnosidase
MVGFVEAVVREQGPALSSKPFQFGDWLDPLSPPKDPFGRTSRELIAGASLVRSLDVLRWSADALGRETTRWAELAAHYRRVWRERFTGADGLPLETTQTALALAVCCDLLEPRSVQRAGERLADVSRAQGHRIGTGFVGTPLLLDALTLSGQRDEAYQVLLERGCPSFLYPVLSGATTVWERWDSLLPDGSTNAAGMTSFNHYALGSVIDWVHRVLCGLQLVEPAYEVFRVAPQPGGGLSFAELRRLTPYGEVNVAWSLADGELGVQVEVPFGSHALLELPGQPSEQVGPGRHSRSVVMTGALT